VWVADPGSPGEGDFCIEVGNATPYCGQHRSGSENLLPRQGTGLTMRSHSDTDWPVRMECSVHRSVALAAATERRLGAAAECHPTQKMTFIPARNVLGLIQATGRPKFGPD
jgi:hypothetical protein